MSEWAEAAAVRFETAAAELRRFVEACDLETWQKVVPGEERPVGVLCYHLAAGIDLNLGWVELLRRDQPVPGSSAAFDERNAAEAREHAGVTKAEVLELLDREVPRGAGALRGLDDDELPRGAAFGPGDGIPLTVERVATANERHINLHLGNIRERLGVKAAT